MRNNALRLCLLAALIIVSSFAFAGGPLFVGGPQMGTFNGKPLTWNPASMPIQYRVDGGPLSQTSTGTVVIDNATGVARVDTLFSAWHNVTTANVSFHNAGSILAVSGFSDGDVSTVAEYNAVDGSCANGQQSPIMFDADGSLTMALFGDPLIIGFAGACALDSQGHYVVSAEAVLDGKWVDGVSQNQLSADQFDAAFIHEFGHFIGLDHSQINLDCLDTCNADSMKGLPTMFPILMGADQKSLATDDMAWVTKLYPGSTASANYGTVKGNVVFSDGVTGAQGVNVILRQVDNSSTATVNESRVYAVSAVSGNLFTGNPGQSLTANYLPCDTSDPNCPASGFLDDNTDGSMFGSRDASLTGSFEMMVPPGTYTVEVESINPGFTGGSSVGSLDPPVALPGVPFTMDNHITVTAGSSTNVTIVLRDSFTQFDTFESSELWPSELPPGVPVEVSFKQEVPA
jgi:hypothetical protein